MQTDQPRAAQDMPKFLRVADVAELLEVSESRAYKIMRKLNKELEQKHKGTYSATQIREFANAYGYGFCKGLDDAFKLQHEQHKQEWGLVLIVPQEVADAMNDMGKASSFGRVRLGGPNDRFAADGYQDGAHFDPSTKLAQLQRGIAKNAQHTS